MAAVSSLRQGEVAFSLGDQADLLETIEESADRLTALVTTLLDMSQLQNGWVPARQDPLDVGAAFATAAGGLADATGVRLALDAGLPFALGDAGLLDWCGPTS